MGVGAASGSGAAARPATGSGRDHAAGERLDTGELQRESGKGYREFLGGLAAASGLEIPTAAEVRAFDRRRRKKTSNREWTQPVDPEARIVRTKCGRTRLSRKVEHAVDLEGGALAAVTVQPADRGDTKTLAPTPREATANLEDAGSECGSPRAVVCDRGYHSNATMVRLRRAGMRSYVSEPARGRWRWKGRREAQRAVYGNRRRMRGANGKRLMIQVAGFNLSLLMRHRYRVGKPRCLQSDGQGRLSRFSAAPTRRYGPRMAVWALFLPLCAPKPPHTPFEHPA